MIAFFASAISIFLNIQVRLSATLLGSMFLIWVLTLHIPLVIAHVHDETQWTSLFVALAMCGISFILAGAFNKKSIAYNSKY